jgi:hypothetical protein
MIINVMYKSIKNNGFSRNESILVNKGKINKYKLNNNEKLVK